MPIIIDNTGSDTLTLSPTSIQTLIQNNPYTSLGSISGTNTITASATPAITAYAVNQTFRFISVGANTGPVTININGLGAKNITKTTGSGQASLAAGDIPAAGVVLQITYDGTQFQMLAAVTAGVSGSTISATTVKTDHLQLGDSGTTSQNFTLQTNLDGTAKLARGNVGATTQDIITIDANGLPDFTQLTRVLGAEGMYTLPGGLIIKWGTCTSNTTPVAKSFPTPFPSAIYGVWLTSTIGSGTGYQQSVTSVTTSGFSAHNGSTLNTCYYIALGV